MLLAADAKPGKVPISFEALGQARAFLMRLRAESDAHADFINSCKQVLAARVKRHPDRWLRTIDVNDFVRQWRSLPDQRYRIAFSDDRKRKHGCVIEIRIGHFSMIAVDDDNEKTWTNYENNASIEFISLELQKHSFAIECHKHCVFSHHALARRIQRGRQVDDARLKADIIFWLPRCWTWVETSAPCLGGPCHPPDEVSLFG